MGGDIDVTMRRIAIIVIVMIVVIMIVVAMIVIVMIVIVMRVIVMRATATMDRSNAETEVMDVSVEISVETDRDKSEIGMVTSVSQDCPTTSSWSSSMPAGTK